MVSISVGNAQLHRCYSSGVTILGEGHDWFVVSTSLPLSKRQKCLPLCIWLPLFIYSPLTQPWMLALHLSSAELWECKGEWRIFIRSVSQWADISNFSSSLTSLVLANCRLLLPMTHFQVTAEWVRDDRWFRDHDIHWLDSLLQDDCHALWMSVRAMGLGLRDNYSFSLIQFVEN